MLRSLRARLIVSHILPLLVIGPLVGLALIYVLETQILLPALLRELTDQARLIVSAAGGAPGIWTDSAQAQAFVASTSSSTSARLMLITADGRLLASSDAADADRVGQAVDIPDLESLRAGQLSTRAAYGPLLETEIADALLPVLGPDRRVMGIVRLTYRLTDVYDRFAQLRYAIAGVLALGLALGAALGFALALNIERPLHRITQAVFDLAGGLPAAPVPLEGPADVVRLVRAFNILVERLQALEDSRQHLLANLLHELGTPLGALRSGVQALQGGAADDEALRSELLAGIDDELRGLQRLLDDLVRHYDHVLGSVELHKEPVDPAAWLSRVLAPWHEAARKKGMQWLVTIQPDLPAIAIDRGALAHALGNLISNALKYTPAGGKLSIESGAAGGRFWIRVADSGPGIPLQEQERIFTPFYRGARRRRFAKGMGIGLSIARDLTAAHGGRLDVQSEPGAGSCFTISLPIESQPSLKPVP